MLRIADFRLAPGEPLFTLAEIGLNHGGSLDRGLALVDAAAYAGASAIKLQVLTPDCLVSRYAPPPQHVGERTGASGPSLVELFRQFELKPDEYRLLVERARRHAMAVVATPLSEEAVGLLEEIGIDAYKIASGDITHAALIERAGSTGRPLIISTGMSNLDEVATAVEHARAIGVRGLALLHCVSCYPVPAGHEHLRAIDELARAFNVPVGLSDHGSDPMAAPLAVALGAVIYERHIMLPHQHDAVDRAVSSTPSEFADIVRTAERARLALGDGHKRCLPIESVNRMASRRRLCAARPLNVGDTIRPDDIVALRPGGGLDSIDRGRLVGRVLMRPLAMHEPFSTEDLGEMPRKVPHAV
jgi:sialic acid synthase SpsE